LASLRGYAEPDLSTPPIALFKIDTTFCADFHSSYRVIHFSHHIFL
jgi:hypothetical protein